MEQCKRHRTGDGVRIVERAQKDLNNTETWTGFFMATNLQGSSPGEKGV